LGKQRQAAKTATARRETWARKAVSPLLVGSGFVISIEFSFLNSLVFHWTDHSPIRIRIDGHLEELARRSPSDGHAEKRNRPSVRSSCPAQRRSGKPSYWEDAQSLNTESDMNVISVLQTHWLTTPRICGWHKKVAPVACEVNCRKSLRCVHDGGEWQSTTIMFALVDKLLADHPTEIELHTEMTKFPVPPRFGSSIVRALFALCQKKYKAWIHCRWLQRYGRSRQSQAETGTCLSFQANA